MVVINHLPSTSNAEYPGIYTDDVSSSICIFSIAKTTYTCFDSVIFVTIKLKQAMVRLTSKVIGQ